jgi:H+-transporting ATPase
MYLKISLSDYMSVFNSRTKGWMWSRAPSRVLVGACIFATSISTILSLYWPFGNGMQGISGDVALLCGLYVLFWAVLQDAAKVMTYSILHSLGYVESVDVIDEEALKQSREDFLAVSVRD